MSLDLNNYIFYNEDCILGCRTHIPDNSIDLIVTDPPYGINGDKLHKHYNRNEDKVIDGYIEVPQKDYPSFSDNWINEAARILRPGGSLYIVSGYTNLIHILNSLSRTDLTEVNHLIWKYNFGVHTTNKYVSSHYHILYYTKNGVIPTFNTYCRFGPNEKDANDGSLNYQDREDVWVLNKEYKRDQIKNKNELPKSLLTKIIQYSSNENDIVCDLFLGSFSTAKVAIGLNRRAIGFELNSNSFDYQIKEIVKVKKGYLLSEIRMPDQTSIENQGAKWETEDIKKLCERYDLLYKDTKSKKDTIKLLQVEFKRGYFSILNTLNKYKIKEIKPTSLFDK